MWVCSVWTRHSPPQLMQVEPAFSVLLVGFGATDTYKQVVRQKIDGQNR